MKLASVCLVACWCLMALTKAAEVEAAAVEVDEDVEELPIDDRDDLEAAVGLVDVEQDAVEGDLSEDRRRCPWEPSSTSKRCRTSGCRYRCKSRCKQGGRGWNSYGCKTRKQYLKCRSDCAGKTSLNWQKYRCAKTMCKYKQRYSGTWNRYNG